MKNTKKILSLALTLAMLLSAVFCTGAVATAETTPTAFGYTAVTHSDPNVSVDLGQNLIPDSTVAEFDKNGNYGAYYGTTDGAVDRTKIANANAWWSSTHCDRAYTNWTAMQGPGVSGRVSKTVTHTEDGSGSIVHDYGATEYNSTFLNLPATETNTYYLFSFWVKSTAGSYLTIKFFNNDNALGGLQSTINTTTTWTQKMFIVSVANTKLDSFMGYNADANIKVYIDDIELYKLDGTYAEKCIAATKLLNGYTDSDTRKFVKTLTVDASFDFGTLGTNLAYDPNVSKFVDGVYDTTNGIKQGGAVGDGTVTFSTTGSHTSDGSGSVCLGTKNKNYAFSIAPKMAAKSYYLITYFVKPSEWKDTELRHYYSASSDSFVNLKTTNKGQWYRIVYIIYTGNTTPDTAIGTYTNTNVYYDDFGVYKLDPKYATECIAAGALSTPPTDEPAALTQNIKLFKVDTKTDLEQFGPNLFPDANVSAFDADGVYKDYSADSNAWWSKDTAWKKGGLKANGYITKDDTHTADGSGTLAINGHAYLPVPTMEANSYYVLSAWVKDPADTAHIQSAIYNSSKSELQAQQNFSGGAYKAWSRVVYLIRTGNAPLD
ncbi:MAG: hypothetical protein UHE86_01630, partial [Acutalibacteraceae bacterium]|nr:hypothetical protein [Acutalibacteraceae bacterium]